MPRARYRSHLSLEAVAFVITLPKRRQLTVLDAADQIAAHPFRIGDFQSLDATGRVIENVLIERYLFSFWIDHASKEVRITEIIRV